MGTQTPQAALRLFELALGRAGSALTAFELMSDVIVGFVTRHVPDSTAPLEKNHPWQVMMEISSLQSPEDARSMLEQILAEAIDKGFVDDAVITSSIAQFRSLWRLRENMSDSQKFEGFSIKHDISVPVAAIPEFIARAGEAVKAVAPGARVVCFGHMGDGNLHYNISQPQDGDSEAFKRSYGRVKKAVHAVVRSLDGSISAEHGIGQLKRDELVSTAPPVATELMRRIKAALDPSGIMNPGKLI